jgi:hypothetical protein
MKSDKRKPQPVLETPALDGVVQKPKLPRGWVIKGPSAPSPSCARSRQRRRSALRSKPTATRAQRTTRAGTSSS